MKKKKITLPFEKLPTKQQSFQLLYKHNPAMCEVVEVDDTIVVNSLRTLEQIIQKQKMENRNQQITKILKP